MSGVYSGLHYASGQSVPFGPGLILVFDRQIGCLLIFDEHGQTVYFRSGDNKAFYPAGIRDESDFKAFIELICEIYSVFYIRVDYGNQPRESSTYLAYRLMTIEQFIQNHRSNHTVRELKDLFEKRFPDFFRHCSSEKYLKLLDFWERLNRLGARNIKKIPPEQCQDIDSTVILTPEEWGELTQELFQLNQ